MMPPIGARSDVCFALFILLLCGFLGAVVAFVRTWRRDRAEIAARAAGL